jgi:hypothetical protein
MTGRKFGADPRAANTRAAGGPTSLVGRPGAPSADQGDLFPLRPDDPVVDALRAAPESVLLDDLADAAMMLGRLGGNNGIGKHSVDQLRHEIIMAAKALALMWTRDGAE